uniref:Protein CONTINUOUS VASCULAR RING 1 isoform X2 n=1 Tax=Elaeis guineensis var. tenera TaxID=51953 RepID=A0A6J0PG40_ELAGV|nr:protein CONTINUOUS VASCULAR RING 1 isoform X2 [Elaeis guineensis]
MGDEKKASSAMGSRERDRELLIPVAEDPAEDSDSKASASSSAAVHHHSGREAFYKVVRSWASKKFMTGCVILFPIAITFYITWWFIHFVDGFFSPIYAQLGINIFDQNTQAFKEVAIIRHPRIGEYAFGFITSAVVLQGYSGEEELYCVYVPTNHLYIGDIFLVNAKDVIRPNLSVREGIEIVVSGGMSMPQILSTLDSHTIQVDRTRSSRN